MSEKNLTNVLSFSNLNTQTMDDQIFLDTILKLIQSDITDDLSDITRSVFNSLTNAKLSKTDFEAFMKNVAEERSPLKKMLKRELKNVSNIKKKLQKLSDKYNPKLRNKIQPDFNVFDEETFTRYSKQLRDQLSLEKKEDTTKKRQESLEKKRNLLKEAKKRGFKGDGRSAIKTIEEFLNQRQNILESVLKKQQIIQTKIQEKQQIREKRQPFLNEVLQEQQQFQKKKQEKEQVRERRQPFLNEIIQQQQKIQKKIDDRRLKVGARKGKKAFEKKRKQKKREERQKRIEKFKEQELKKKYKLETKSLRRINYDYEDVLYNRIDEKNKKRNIIVKQEIELNTLQGQLKNIRIIFKNPYTLLRENNELVNFLMNKFNKIKKQYKQGVFLSAKVGYYVIDYKKNVELLSEIEELKIKENKTKDDHIKINELTQRLHDNSTHRTERISIEENNMVVDLFKLFEKYFYQSEIILHIDSVDILVSPLSERGGCLKDNKKVEDRINLNNAKMKIHNFKSINNNCLFAVFNNHYKIKGNELKSDKVRKDLNFQKGEQIHYKDIPRIVEYYNKKFNKDFEFIVINKNLEIISYCEGDLISLNSQMNKEFDYDNFVKIMLKDGHYFGFEITKYKRCEKCNEFLLDANTTHRCCNSTIARNLNLDKSEYVKNKKIENKYELGYGNVLFFDFETFPLKNGVLQPYAVGFTHKKEYQYYWGEDCVEKFVDYIFEQGHNISNMIAYNGSRFDFYFIINALIKRGIKLGDKLLLSSGRLLNFKFNPYDAFPNYEFIGETEVFINGKLISLKDFHHEINVFDLCQFLMCPLKQACVDFKVPDELTKGDYDTLKIKKMKDADDDKEEILKYLKNDVLSLKDIFVKFNKYIYETKKINITNYITISSMSYSIWTSTLEELVEVPKDKEKLDFVIKSVFGGRCHPVVKHTVSPHYDDVINGKMSYQEFYESGKFIFNADCTSLYPASMSGCDLMDVKYPVGISRWSDNGEEEFKNGKLGFYHIKFETNKNISVSILPRRGDNGGVEWSLKDGEGIYNTIDIENAIDAGYKVTFLGKCLVYDNESNIFKKYIEEMYMWKEEAERDGNEVKRSIAKLMMNALYGKTLQRPITEKTEIVSGIDTFNQFVSKYELTDWTILNENTIILTGQEINVEKVINKPFQMGSFVLSYSRRLMNKFMTEIDPKLEKVLFTYTDTDSLHIGGQDYFKLKEKGLIKSKTESKLGYLCSDIKGEGLIIQEKNLGPKNYMYEYITNDNKICRAGDATMKCKGLHFEKKDKSKSEEYNNDVKEKRDKYFNWYLNEKPEEMKYNSLKKIHKKISSIEKSDNIEHFSIKAIECTRTFNKTTFNNMDFNNNIWLPFGCELKNINFSL